MHITLTQRYLHYPPGKTISVRRALAQELLDSGVAVPPGATPTVETAEAPTVSEKRGSRKKK